MDIFYGKTVVISGASSGIGRKFTEELIFNHSAKVIAIARSEKKIAELLSDMGEKRSALVKYFLFDVSVEENWINLAKTLDSEGIKIDAVINCAGILAPFKKFDDFSSDEFKRIFEVDYFSCVYSARHLMPLLKGDTPTVVNVSSSSALCTFAGISGYSAAKSALKTFTLTLAEEYRGKINFCCVCPGFTKTNIFSNIEISEKEFLTAQRFSSDCGKIVKKAIRKINAGKKLVVIGYDAKLMNFFYKIAPITTAKLITKILIKSKLKTFENIR